MIRLKLWHGRWHRIAIAEIAEQGQVLADVGKIYALACGFAVNANIHAGIRIFNTGVSSGSAQAGSISVRLREPFRLTNRGRHEVYLDACVIHQDLLDDRAELLAVASQAVEPAQVSRWLGSPASSAQRLIAAFQQSARPWPG